MKGNQMDVSKLPAWAQERLRVQHDYLEEQDKRIKELEGNIKDSDTAIEVHKRNYTGREFHYLRSGTTVRFNLGPNSREYVEVRVLRDKENGGKPTIQLMGGDMLELLPRSGNVAYVRIEKD